jgi:outer membrane protein OmpA-like peptidoglycan-associated protein
MKSYRVSVIAVVLLLSVGSKSVLAGPDPYDDSQSNPFRIAAYLLYPAAFLTEWIIFRPFHYLVSATEAQEAFFGHNPHPPVLSEPQPLYDYGLPKRVPLAETKLQAKPAAAPVAAQPPAPEQIRIVEVPVEKIVIKEVPKIVEVEKLVFPLVAFAFDSANLTDLGKGQVYLAAQRLKEKAELTVAIEGHADNQGNDEYNQKLGMQRAQTVMNELAALGVDRSRMSSASFGESKPLIQGDATWARAVNRRVEFQIKAN